jgi:subtilisin family serine protease
MNRPFSLRRLSHLSHGTRPRSAVVRGLRSTPCTAELLESRLTMSADVTATALRQIEWHGQTAAARSDAWIVRAPATSAATGWNLAPAWNPAWHTTSLGEGFYALSTPGASTQDVLGWAARTTGVSYVEPDFAIAPTIASNDPSRGQLWGLDNTGQSGGVVDADIDAPEAWNTTTGSRSVVVAVIDTGMDYNHPDLAANAWRNPGEVAGDGIDNDRNGFVDDVMGWDFANNDANPMDDNGHGSHVSGTIGAVGNNGTGVVGVNWQVSIMPLKFLDASGSGSTSAAVAAINYATRMRRDFGINVVATNNSWGGGGLSTALRDAVDAGAGAGILFVAAAGNESNNNDATPSYPASHPGTSVISVAATDRSNRLATFSNYGATSVDLAAPGVAILSTTPNKSYASYSGTSMATPHVTGTVALLAAANPQATAAQIRTAILSSTTPVAGLAGKVATGGLLNAAAALQALGAATPAPSPTPVPSPTPTPSPVDAGDTLAAAVAVTASSGSVRCPGQIGDGQSGRRDVDLYRVVLQAGQSLTIDVDARSLSSSSTLDSYVRLFDSRGRELARNDDANGSLDSLLSVVTRTGGTYYVGISGYGNSAYTATRAGSGRTGSTGVYEVAFSFGAVAQRTGAKAAAMRMMGAADATQPMLQACGAGQQQATLAQRTAVKRWTMVWR